MLCREASVRKSSAVGLFFRVLRGKNTKSFLILHQVLYQKKKIMGKSTFLQEFKDFAVKGNAIDMAVGVIIGGAFGKIVTSIVNDLIMPPIGWIIGGVDFKDLKLELPVNPLSVKEGMEAVPVTINYGNFLQTTLDFIIIAFCVFLLVRLVMKLSKKKKEEKPAAPAPPPAPSKEEVLLTEIRDLLKEKK